jgi:DNA-binding response OmpR family regulator
MPLGELEDEAMGKLLLVGMERPTRGQMLELMPPEDYKIEVANSGFEAGIQAESHHPDCMIIDFGMGRVEAMLIAQNLRKNQDYADAVLVALLSDDDTASGFDRSIFNETFRKPFDAALLAERCRTLIGRKKQLA